MNRTHPPKFPRYQINPEEPRWTDALGRVVVMAVFATVVIVALALL